MPPETADIAASELQNLLILEALTQYEIRTALFWFADFVEFES
jgi:hypothetical protein